MLLSAILLFSAIGSEGSTFRTVTFATDDGGTIGGSLFVAKQNRAVVFAHGAAFNKESWYSLAERLQKEGITALAIDFRGYGNSRPGRTAELYRDLLGALGYLEKEGCQHISLVGGSMGGAAILRALGHTVDPRIESVILLAPAGGDPSKSTTVRKLFVVAEQDRFRATVSTLYDGSAEPKQLKVYSGSAHAQHLFKTEHGKDLTSLIVHFLGD